VELSPLSASEGADGDRAGTGHAAEEEARRTVAVAEAEARAVREAARAVAERLEEESRRRREATRDAASAPEERRRRSLEHLREFAAAIDDLLHGAPALEADPERSRVDALSRKRRR